MPDPLDPDLDEPYGKRPSTEVTRFRSRPSVDKGVIISYMHPSRPTLRSISEGAALNGIMMMIHDLPEV